MADAVFSAIQNYRNRDNSSPSATPAPAMPAFQGRNSFKDYLSKDIYGLSTSIFNEAKTRQADPNAVTSPGRQALDALKVMGAGALETVAAPGLAAYYFATRDPRKFVDQQTAPQAASLTPEQQKIKAEQEQFNKYAEAYNAKFNALTNPTNNMPALSREMAAQQASRDPNVVNMLPEAARKQFAEMESQRAAPSAQRTAAATESSKSASPSNRLDQVRQVFDFARANGMNPALVGRWMGFEPTKSDFKEMLAKDIYAKKMQPYVQEYMNVPAGPQYDAERAKIRQRQELDSENFLRTLGLY